MGLLTSPFVSVQLCFLFFPAPKTVDCTPPPPPAAPDRCGAMPMPDEKKPASSPLASAAAPARDPHLDAQMDALLSGRHADPFALLGPHPQAMAGSFAFSVPAPLRPASFSAAYPSPFPRAGCVPKDSLKPLSRNRSKARPRPAPIAFAIARATAKPSKPLTLTRSPIFSASSIFISWVKGATTTPTKSLARI